MYVPDQRTSAIERLMEQRNLNKPSDKATISISLIQDKNFSILLSCLSQRSSIFSVSWISIKSFI
jgi:hypothetical protein